MSPKPTQRRDGKRAVEVRVEDPAVEIVIHFDSLSFPGIYIDCISRQMIKKMRINQRILTMTLWWGVSASSYFVEATIPMAL